MKTIPNRIANGTFLLVVLGESYFTEIVKGPDIVNRMMAAMYSEDESLWTDDDREYWADSVYDEDNWTHDPDFGPTSFTTDVGETDHIQLYRIEPNRPVEPSSPPPAPTHAGEHSPTPWTIRPGYSIESSDDKIVCDLNLAHQDRKANAERIVACVHFCEGYTSEFLSHSFLHAYVKVVEQNQSNIALLQRELAGTRSKRRDAENEAESLRTQLADLRKKLGESEAKANFKQQSLLSTQTEDNKSSN